MAGLLVFLKPNLALCAIILQFYQDLYPHEKYLPGKRSHQQGDILYFSILNQNNAITKVAHKNISQGCNKVRRS